jgi:hypothetical protein
MFDFVRLIEAEPPILQRLDSGLLAGFVNNRIFAEAY